MTENVSANLFGLDHALDDDQSQVRENLSIDVLAKRDIRSSGSATELKAQQRVEILAGDL